MTMAIYTRAFALVCLVVVFLAPAFSAEARHNDDDGGDGEWYSSSVQRKINDLDDDEVDEFEIPVLFGIALTNLTSNFGDPRDGGARTHEGLDMMATLGTPIVSPTEAVVVGTGDGDSSGKYVRTVGPGGESFVYMHLDDIADIDEGDVLDVGDYIGTVGDTGNASGGAAHLHFEIREDGEAKDPFPRIDKEFTLKEKMSLVVGMWENLDDEDEMAEFLVETYEDEFETALNSGYTLPNEIKSELKKKGIVSTASLIEQLDTIIKSIPKVVTKDLTIGAQGVEVSLAQFYLIYMKTGPAATALANAGATGYFGTVTEAALKEYQKSHDVEQTGIYDADTREEMVK